MMAKAAYGLLFLVTLALQTGVVVSLPEPYRLFPLALVVGIIVLHERSVVVGAWWILASGFLLEIRGLGDGLMFAGLVAAVVATTLTLPVFAKRSFWALLGVGTAIAVAYIVGRLVWLMFWAIFSDRALNFGSLAQQGLMTILMTIIGVFVFGAYIRRFLGWSRGKFVSKGQSYDISFPH